jgi:hypothetical protein
LFIEEVCFKLISGHEELTDYQFGKKTIHHFFCKICGVTSFGEGTIESGSKFVAVNIRCLDGVNLEEVNITNVDGKGR